MPLLEHDSGTPMQEETLQTRLPQEQKILRWPVCVRREGLPLRPMHELPLQIPGGGLLGDGVQNFRERGKVRESLYCCGYPKRVQGLPEVVKHLPGLCKKRKASACWGCVTPLVKDLDECHSENEESSDVERCVNERASTQCAKCTCTLLCSMTDRNTSLCQNCQKNL